MRIWNPELTILNDSAASWAQGCRKKDSVKVSRAGRVAAGRGEIEVSFAGVREIRTGRRRYPVTNRSDSRTRWNWPRAVCGKLRLLSGG